jgi:hypothetical protein
MNKNLIKLKKIFYFWILLVLTTYPSEIFSQRNSNLEIIVNDFLSGDNTYDKISEYIKHNSIEQERYGIQTYLNHKDEKIRTFIYQILFELIKKEKDLRAKRDGVFVLMDRGLVDPDAGNTYRVLDYLDEFPLECFDNRIKSRLASIIMQKPSHFSKMILLTGKIEIIELINYFELNLADKTKISPSEFWSINLALARMGDETKADYCVKRIKAIGINDEVVFRLVPDLIYTRQKMAFDYLLNEIMNGNLNCTSTDPDHEVAIICAYRLIEMIAPFIKDFPVGVTESGELAASNYEEALITVRSWIETHRENYQILME